MSFTLLRVLQKYFFWDVKIADDKKQGMWLENVFLICLINFFLKCEKYIHRSKNVLIL